MKKGRASSRRLSVSPSQGGCRGGGWRAVLISLSPPRVGGHGADGSSLRWRISLGTVRRPGVGGAFGSGGLVAGEHVPDRLGEPAGEIDLRDLDAAQFADARFRLLVAVAMKAKAPHTASGWSRNVGADQQRNAVARRLGPASQAPTMMRIAMAASVRPDVLRLSVKMSKAWAAGSSLLGTLTSESTTKFPPTRMMARTASPTRAARRRSL